MEWGSTNISKVRGVHGSGATEVCCCCLQLLGGGGIVGVRVICDFGSTKGNELLSEPSEEKTHEWLIRTDEMMDG